MKIIFYYILSCYFLFFYPFLGNVCVFVLFLLIFRDLFIISNVFLSISCRLNSVLFFYGDIYSVCYAFC